MTESAVGEYGVCLLYTSNERRRIDRKCGRIARRLDECIIGSRQSRAVDRIASDIAVLRRRRREGQRSRRRRGLRVRSEKSRHRSAKRRYRRPVSVAARGRRISQGRLTDRKSGAVGRRLDERVIGCLLYTSRCV